VTAVDDPAARRALVSPHAVALLVLAAAAWITLALVAGSDMTAASTFLPAWALMMTAMMLPAVAPVASLYVRTIPGGSQVRLLGFVAGYLLVWSVSAVPAYALSLLVMHQISPHPLAARLTAAGIFAVCGVYQLTGLKDRCLRHCRSPLGQLMRYASYDGPARDLRVGMHHAAYCLGCCWALMLLLFAFGTMTLLAALGLCVLVVMEKLSPAGRQVSRLISVAALGLAVVALFAPAIAPGLAPMMAPPGGM
jgi:predicted metal-binding membrane protein